VSGEGAMKEEELGPTHASPSSRAADLVAFWSGVLPDLRNRVPLFANVQPAPYPFIKKMHNGIQYRLNIKLDHSSVWLQVHRASREESEATYRQLLIHKEQIEAALPEEVGWDSRPVGEWDSLLLWMWATRSTGLEHKAKWGETQRALVLAASSLVRVTAGYLPKSDWSAS
jgi:hypothetical protein